MAYVKKALVEVACCCGAIVLRKRTQPFYQCPRCRQLAQNRRRRGRHKPRTSEQHKTAYQRRKDDPGYLARRKESHRRLTEKRRAGVLTVKRCKPRRDPAEVKCKREERARIAAEATAARAAAHAERAAKPWNAPGLSAAEKWATRYKLDTAFAIKERQRAAFRRTRNGHKIGDTLRAALKSGRETSLSDFLGYTADELRAHLGRQFDGRMSWAAFHAGRIHIDHVVPISAFDVRDPEELRAAWALSNLRPLYKRKNLSKGARRTHLL